MGKNVYAAPRKGPAGKWVEQSGEKGYVKNNEQERQERMKALAAKYKKNTGKEKESLLRLWHTVTVASPG